MRLEQFDFELPEDRIALRPVDPRDSAKMLVLDQGIRDFQVRDLPQLLNRGDVVVFNDTKVVPTQLSGRRIRSDSSAQVSLTLHTRLSSQQWLCFAKGAKKLKPGDRIRFTAGGSSDESRALDCTVVSKDHDGNVALEFDIGGADLDAAIADIGAMPLPPYIAGRRAADSRDFDDYQTTYANKTGAVAAPTAGLHFTPDLLEALENKGIVLKFVTLHVGPGTFLPVKAEEIKDHQMHSEWGIVSPEIADAINTAKAAGGRLVCVGTTSLRLIESAAQPDGTIMPWQGETDIFITPGYRFRAVDLLMTNFHLPKSTLFMLVAAFCGLETMKAAYAHAIENKYRFYSYGDSSLLYRQS